MKITVVGAGNVGATCANVMAQKELASEIILLDIKEGFAEGKALDIMQTAALLEFDTRVIGVTGDYSKTAGSDVVVITSGIPRKPGMTREDLIGTNAGIVNDVPKNRVIGMGGILDSARFKFYLSEALQCQATDLQGTVIGGHGDTTMIPLTRLATCNGVPASAIIGAEALAKVAADTMVGGATCTKLLGTSAWIAPGAAGAALVESIVRDQKKVFPCCVALDGEYGQKDICIGVPVVIGKNGVEKIVDYKLNAEEQAEFNKSADAVRNMNGVLKELNIL